MKNKKKKNEEMYNNNIEYEQQNSILKRKTLKEIIAPAGIDVSDINHLEIISNTKRYARRTI